MVEQAGHVNNVEIWIVMVSKSKTMLELYFSVNMI